MQKFSNKVTETMDQFVYPHQRLCLQGGAGAGTGSSVILIEGLWEEWLPGSWRTSECLKSMGALLHKRISNLRLHNIQSCWV